MIAEDFNAKALEWGRPVLTLGGGVSWTLKRPGYRETIIDVSLVSEQLAERIEDWRVIEDITGSDQKYITFHMRRFSD